MELIMLRGKKQTWKIKWRRFDLICRTHMCRYTCLFTCVYVHACMWWNYKWDHKRGVRDFKTVGVGEQWNMYDIQPKGFIIWEKRHHQRWEGNRQGQWGRRMAHVYKNVSIKLIVGIKLLKCMCSPALKNRKL